MPTTSSVSTVYEIDLNAVHDGNRVGMTIGLFGPQVVPEVGQSVVVLDNEGNMYEAKVESVLPDRRVYMRVAWKTKMATTPNLPAFASFVISVPGAKTSAAAVPATVRRRPETAASTDMNRPRSVSFRSLNVKTRSST